MQVWNVLHAARWNAGPKKLAKNRHLGTIAQLCWATGMSSQLRHISTIGKKVDKQQYVLQMSPQYGELRPTSGWDRFTSLGTPANFNGLRVLAALLHGSQRASTKLCGAEQKAPPMFGRVTITLRIGPHSSFRIYLYSNIRLQSYWTCDIFNSNSTSTKKYQM